jgi:hypothetical protein
MDKLFNEAEKGMLLTKWGWYVQEAEVYDFYSNSDEGPTKVEAWVCEHEVDLEDCISVNRYLPKYSIDAVFRRELKYRITKLLYDV